MSHHWLIPDWPAPANVRALCTTRLGGVSASPFDSMNLGAYVGDAAQSVAANKQRLAHTLAPAAHAVWNHQVHGAGVRVVDARSADEEAFDASVTRGGGVACTATVADCLPVLFCDAAGTVCGAAHAGWRGLAAGVLENTLRALQGAFFEENRHYVGDFRTFIAIENVASDMGNVMAWLGPCIGPMAFEVGPEVREAFVRQHAEAAACFKAGKDDRWLCDLAALARLRLIAAGLSPHYIYGNDSSDAWCTVGNPHRFFSHRRDGGRAGAGADGRSGGTGRMAAAICLL